MERSGAAKAARFAVIPMDVFSGMHTPARQTVLPPGIALLSLVFIVMIAVPLIGVLAPIAVAVVLPEWVFPSTVRRLACRYREAVLRSTRPELERGTLLGEERDRRCKHAPNQRESHRQTSDDVQNAISIPAQLCHPPTSPISSRRAPEIPRLLAIRPDQLAYIPPGGPHLSAGRSCICL